MAITGKKISELDEASVNAFKDILGIGEKIIDVTYDELLALMDSSGDGLVPGQFYRITDFATVHYMVDNVTATADINTGSTEPLIVLAISESALDSRAYSELYPYDVIHYDWNPANWLTDISFGGNDETLVTGFKGVIYFRHDTLHDNYMGYDFRNVKFRRWNNGFEVGDVWASEYQACSSTDAGVTDPEDYIDVLTFNCPGGEEQYNVEVRGVHIESFKDQSDLSYNANSILCNNVFHLGAGFGWYQVFTNTIGSLSCFNTFNGYIEANIIGNAFYGNIIGNNFYSNTIGNSFNDNTIENEFHSNTIENYFFNNRIGNGFKGNTIENYFSSNIIGNNFHSNTIGNGFNDNTIENEFHSNTIGNYFFSNTIGNSCQNITAENNVTHITIADSCTNIRIGNSSSYIELGDSSGGVYNIDIGQGCGGNGQGIVIGTGSYSISIADGCNNITIGEYVYYITFGEDCGHGSAGEPKPIIIGNDCLDITFGQACGDIILSDDGPADIIFGNACGILAQINITGYSVSLVFGTLCQSITIGNNCSGITFGPNCGIQAGWGGSYPPITIADDCYNIEFGTWCNNITIAESSYNVKIGQGSSYIELGDSSGGVNNIDIGQGCGGNGQGIVIGGGSYDIIIGQQCFAINISSDCFGQINIGQGCSNITVGTGCFNIVFDAYCSYITIGNDTGALNFIGECDDITVGDLCYAILFNNVWSCIIGDGCKFNTLYMCQGVTLPDSAGMNTMFAVINKDYTDSAVVQLTEVSMEHKSISIDRVPNPIEVDNICIYYQEDSEGNLEQVITRDVISMTLL